MIKFEEKEYDLNLLCNFTFDFQILKEVLLKLAKSNHKLEKKIKRLEKSNEEKNKRLLTVEDRLNILFIPEENVYSNSEASEEKIEQKDENKNIEEKKEEKEIKEEEKKEDKKEEEIKEETKKEEKKEEEKKEIYKEEYDEKIIKSKINLDRKKSLREFEYKNSFVQQAPQVSHETIKSLLKLIRENSEKISKLEKNISKKLNKNVKDLERDFYDFNEENTKQHESMKQRIKELNEKLYDYNYKMDGIIVKTAPLDNLSIFRDSGNGSIDATKGMIKLLEQKINKRIEIIEKKSYNDNKEDNNYKNKIEELEGLINKINDKIKNQEQNRNNNNFENIISNYNEDIQEIRDTIDKNYNEVLKLIDDITLKVENGDLVGDKLNEILSKIKTKEEIKIPKLEAESTNKKNIILERSNKDEEDFGDNIPDIKERIKALYVIVDGLGQIQNTVVDLNTDVLIGVGLQNSDSLSFRNTVTSVIGGKTGADIDQHITFGIEGTGLCLNSYIVGTTVLGLDNVHTFARLEQTIVVSPMEIPIGILTPISDTIIDQPLGVNAINE